MTLLKDIVQIEKGRKYNLLEENQEGAIRVFQANDFRNENKPLYTFDKDGVLAQEDDIMLVWDGSVGQMGFGRSGYVGSTMVKLKVKDKKQFSPFFIYRFLQTKAEYLKRKATGATIMHINRKSLEQLEIPDLEIDDQLHIANLLSKAENLIAQRKESIRLLDEFLKSTFLEMFGDPKTNEKGFEIRNLTEFYINPKEGTKCGPFGSALKKDEYTETGIPVWTMDNILKTGEFNETGCLFVSEEKHKELERYNALNGDIIISRAGTVGKMCIVKTDTKKSVISSNLIRLRLGKNLLPIYFYSLMRYCQSRVIKLKHGNEDAYTHMSTGVLDEINFPYPNLKLQTQFAQIVEKTEALKTQYQQSLQELENLYGSLSQKAFRGELSVNQLAKA
jgi:type I restriction enzyme S subunit